MSDMYTRNFGKQKYTPPPGYDGTAFEGNTSTKHHEPKEIIHMEDSLPRIAEYEGGMEENQDLVETKEPDVTVNKVVPVKEVQQNAASADQTVKKLLESIRGHFGNEEMIILLVMLLIAADGISAELIILGILLGMS